MAGKKIVRIDNRKYGELLAQARPRAPRNIQESRRLTAQFGVLMDKGDSLTPEQDGHSDGKENANIGGDCGEKLGEHYG